MPSGFTHTEGTKDTGYVITNNTTGDQFVWVPVDKDQKITLKVSSEENITEMKLYDPYGDEINLGTVSGKTYENTSITPTVNGGYTVKVATANGSKTQTLGVKSLYAVDTLNDFYSSEEGISAYMTRTYTHTKADLIQILKEMNAVSSDNPTDEEIGRAYFKEYNLSEPADDIDYAGKVATNGGFYIGRYEAGNDNGSLVIKSGQTVWNSINHIDALSTAKAYNTSLNSSLLTGASWDRTLGWLVETGNKTLVQVAGDSTSWGNYLDDDNTNDPANTGTTAKAVSNNIYDLAGNVSEWTTEEDYPSYRVYRGGQFYYYFPASNRNRNSPSGYTNDVGFRIALYL